MKKYFTLIFIFSFMLFFMGLILFATSIKAFAQPVEYTKVHAGHILVDTREEALFLKQKIDCGESFETLAKNYSKCPSGQEGGDLGYFERGQMVREFENAAFNLPISTVSEPVQSEFGWHLIKVYDKK